MHSCNTDITAISCPEFSLAIALQIVRATWLILSKPTSSQFHSIFSYVIATTERDVDVNVVAEHRYLFKRYVISIPRWIKYIEKEENFKE